MEKRYKKIIRFLEKLNDINNIPKKWKKDIKKLSDLCK